MNKAELRALARRQRAELTPEYRAEASRRASLALLSSPPFSRAERIALYAAVGTEADPIAVEAAALEKGAAVFYPRVGSDGVLHFASARRAGLVPGFKGIPEPALDAEDAEYASIDLYVVPGTAFDLAGGRLGSGRGHYDRVLARARAARTGAHPFAVGFAFSRQIVGEVPRESHDETLDALVTEAGFALVPPAA